MAKVVSYGNVYVASDAPRPLPWRSAMAVWLTLAAAGWGAVFALARFFA